jgi:hypothetical protein
MEAPEAHLPEDTVRSQHYVRGVDAPLKPFLAWMELGHRDGPTPSPRRASVHQHMRPTRGEPSTWPQCVGRLRPAVLGSPGRDREMVKMEVARVCVRSPSPGVATLGAYGTKWVWRWKSAFSWRECSVRCGGCDKRLSALPSRVPTRADRPVSMS